MTLVTVINKDLNNLIPIIYEFRKETLKHILIYDEGDAENFLLEKLKKGISKNSKAVVIDLIKIDEDNKKDMVHIKNILDKEKNLYLNAADSDLSLVVILSSYILNKEGVVFAYDKYDNTYNKIHKSSFENFSIKNNLTLDDYLSYIRYKKSAEQDVKAIYKFSSQINYIFKTPQKFFLNHYILTKKKAKKLDKSFKAALIGLGIINEKMYFKPSKKSFGSLFEEFIFLKLERYDFDDIKIGVEIIFDEGLYIVNELDIMAIKENHIYIVECKLGNMLEANDVIYKLDSVLENFGEDAKGLIINIQPNIDYFHQSNLNVKKLFSNASHSRANFNNIAIYNDYIFNDSAFDELVREFFNVSLKEHKKIKNEPVFLFGGYDLEMIEIKKLLVKYNKHFIDRKLSWGAKLSQYKDILHKSTNYYGIELIEDIDTPDNYIAIDHHNQYQDNESSLEQVAKMLNVELSRYQKLVSLNDSGYIPAMEKFGATEIEIELIRERDREAQGVTQEDEILAEVAIEEKKEIKDIVIIESQSKYFSPIADRLYIMNIKDFIIYNENKLLYYGKNIKRLVNKYTQEIEKNEMYYGGNFGFFGLSEGIYKAEKIAQLKKTIIQIVVKP